MHTTFNNLNILEEIAVIADEDNMKITIKRVAQRTAVSIGSAVLGLILLGSRGLAIGNMIGTTLAEITMEYTIRLVGEVIRYELSEAQKKALLDLISNEIVGNICDLPSLMRGDAAIKKRILFIVHTFISKEVF